MRKYYVNYYKDFSNTYDLIYTETPEEEKTALSKGYHRIPRKKAFSLCADARYLRKTDPSAAGYASAYIYPLDKDAAYDYMNDEYRIDETGYIMLKI